MEVITPILILLYLIIKDVIRLPSRYETESQIDRLENRLNRISNQLKAIKDQKDEAQSKVQSKRPTKVIWPHQQDQQDQQDIHMTDALIELTEWKQKELERRARIRDREDIEHLQWIHDRIISVYGESKNVDFLIKMREIIKPKQR